MIQHPDKGRLTGRALEENDLPGQQEKADVTDDTADKGKGLDVKFHFSIFPCSGLIPVPRFLKPGPSGSIGCPCARLKLGNSDIGAVAISGRKLSLSVQE